MYSPSFRKERQVTPKRTPLREAPSNLPLRNSQDEEFVQQFGQEKEIKREKARNRCFQMRVNNISILHDKIHGLLDMIKKDKIQENTQKFHNILGDTTKHNKSAIVPRKEITQKEKYQALSVLKMSVQPNKPSPVKQDMKKENKNPIIKGDYIPKQLFRAQEKKKYQYNYNYQQSIPQKNAGKPKRTYLPIEQSVPSMTPTKKKRETSMQEDVDFARYQIKIDRWTEIKKSQQIFNPKINDKYGQNQRSKTPRKEYFQPKFEDIHIQSSPSLQEAARQSCLQLSSTIPKPVASNFQPITINQQSWHQQKLNTTSKLIDQQIRRIKSKIDESESHNEVMQGRLRR